MVMLHVSAEQVTVCHKMEEPAKVGFSTATSLYIPDYFLQVLLFSDCTYPWVQYKGALACGVNSRVGRNQGNTVIGASLSEPHTSGTALWKCVCNVYALVSCPAVHAPRWRAWTAATVQGVVGLGFIRVGLGLG